MRIIAGKVRRMLLVTPKGEETRPTQDIIKETLFNIIQFEIPGCVFVDLCAGSGSIGIEALSRGARHAYFAENGKEACKCIQENLHKTHLEDEGTLLKMDVLSAIHHIHEKHVDLIYLDPPYASDIVETALKELKTVSFVDENTRIIIETSLDSDMDFLEDLGYTLEREKDYRSQRHLFVRKKVQE